MAQTELESVSDYLAAQPPEARRMLARVRAAIRKAVPRAEESISYGIPTFKLGGAPLVYFAGWEKHVSLYPLTPGLLAAFAKELAGHDVQKGTLRFALGSPLPLELVARIAVFRVREVETKAQTKAARTPVKRATPAKRASPAKHSPSSKRSPSATTARPRRG